MHVLPGRIRLRFQEVKYSNLSEELEDTLMQSKDISKVQINNKTGSCLVTFNPNIPVEFMVSSIQKTIMDVLAHPSDYKKERRGLIKLEIIVLSK
ncbi:hypothetical protein N752_22675 [Desulforamulus aquiferis]|nr:hypothetical protein [Desulforamulus aquiferis]RYD02822.1 hypothetical protein N752_22675 [Desulforamulus aquiferis]